MTICVLFVRLELTIPLQDFSKKIAQIIEEEKIDINVKAHVFVGRDNRPSSEHLCALTKLGLSTFDAHVVDFGIVTTPQLHWAVWVNANLPHDMDTYYACLEKVDIFLSVCLFVCLFVCLLYVNFV